MVSSNDIRDYPLLSNPSGFQGITDANSRLIKRFTDRQRLKGVKLSSINTTVFRIAGWMRALKTDAELWSASDVEAEYLRRLDEVTAGRKTDSTLDGELRAVKQLWVFMGKPALDIHRKPTKLNLQSSEIISVEQIMRMRDCAERAGDVRGVALIMSVFGTGCRVSELIDANVKDLEITDQFANLHVDGKTGKRIIPFVVGLPELQMWVNCHPCRKQGIVDADAPLFVTYNTRGHGNRRLSKESVEACFRKYKAQAGIPDSVRCYPHAFRHRGASEDARHLTNAELCLKFGWSHYSDMPHRYCHTDLQELRSTLLKSAGVDVPEIIPDTPLIVQCPRCHTINRAGALYCDKCSLPLNAEFAADLVKANKAIEDYVKHQRRLDMR